MITRHSVIFAAQCVEPDHMGNWVKYEDYERDYKRLDGMAQAKSDRLKELERDHKAVVKELEELRRTSETTIAYQSKIIQTARVRLKVLGHSPNCESRYGVISQDGAQRIRACNCGLDAWMKESLDG